VTYRIVKIQIRTADVGDKDFPTDKPAYVVWALGRLDKTNNEPSFHDVYPRGDVIIELSRKEPENACIDFTEHNHKIFSRCEERMYFGYICVKLFFNIIYEFSLNILSTIDYK